MAGAERDDHSWNEYKRLVLAELERIDRGLGELNRKIDAFRQNDISKIQMDVAMLKGKATAFGAMAGVVATVLVELIMKFGLRS